MFFFSQKIRGRELLFSGALHAWMAEPLKERRRVARTVHLGAKMVLYYVCSEVFGYFMPFAHEL